MQNKKTVNTEKERDLLKKTLEKFQSSSLMTACNLLGLPKAPSKESAIKALVLYLSKKENFLTLLDSFPLHVQDYLKRVASTKETPPYNLLEWTLCANYGYLHSKKVLNKLSSRFLFLPLSLEYERGGYYSSSRMLNASEPKLYKKVWFPRSLVEALGEIHPKKERDFARDAGNGPDYQQFGPVAAKFLQDPPKADFQRASARRLFKDLSAILHYFDKKAVSMTQKGTLPRRDVKALSELLEIQDNRTFDAHNYSDRDLPTYFFFLYSLGLYLGLIQINNQGKHFIKGSLEFEQSSLPEKMGEFLFCWISNEVWDELERVPELRISKYSFSGMEYQKHIHSARALLFYCLKGFKPLEWYDFEPLRKAIRDQAPHFLFGEEVRKYSSWDYKNPKVLYYSDVEKASSGSYRGDRLYLNKDWDKVEGRFIELVFLEPLYWMGLVDYVHHPDDPFRLKGFRITREGALVMGMPVSEEEAPPSPCLIVQGNFEVLVYLEEASEEVLWTLPEFCEKAPGEKILHYKLTRERFYEAFKRNYTAEKILSFLQKYSKVPVPQNVEYSLKDWERRSEKIKFFFQATVLELDSPKMVRKLLKDFEKFPLRQLSEHFVLIPFEKFKAVQRWLKKQGEAVPVCEHGEMTEHCLISGEEMDLLLPPEGDNPYLKYRLSLFADLVAVDGGSYLYEITYESFHRAKKLGISHKKIIEWLGRACKASFSPNFEVTLTGWNNGYSPLAIGTVCLILDDRGEILQEICRVPQLKKLIRLYTPQIGITSVENMEILKEELDLRKIGHSPDLLQKMFPSHPKEKVSGQKKSVLPKKGGEKKGEGKKGTSTKDSGESSDFKASQKLEPGDFSLPKLSTPGTKRLVQQAIEKGEKIMIYYVSKRGKEGREILSPKEIIGPFFVAYSHKRSITMNFEFSRVEGIALWYENLE